MKNLATGLIFFFIAGLLACICASVVFPFVLIMGVLLGFVSKFIGWPLVILALFLVSAYLFGRDLND